MKYLASIKQLLHTTRAVDVLQVMYNKTVRVIQMATVRVSSLLFFCRVWPLTLESRFRKGKTESQKKVDLSSVIRYRHNKLLMK
jgi:hypothetical protein